MVCFLITCVCKGILCFETFSLIDRVVELGICVTHFPCIDKELETLYLVRIGRFLLGQRRDLDRMIHDKCRLDQLFLTVLLEEEVDDVTLLMTILILDMMLVSKLLGCLIICYFVKVDSCIFLDGIVHGQTCERLSKIDLDTIVGNLCGTADLLCKVTEHGLCQLHHSLIISICLIKLHQSELRIVAGINTLVTEYTADLVNSLKSAHDQSLKIKLQGNTKLNVFVVMCLKRSCSCTACVGNQHWCFHFHEVTSCKEITDFLKDLGTFDEYLLTVLVHDKIHISLTITGICICQSVEFLRKDL